MGHGAMNKRTLLSVTGGNSLEWYDFMVYAGLAPIISKAFFPQSDGEFALILTFGIFAVGYLSRPLGGLLIGYLGDRLGRRRALILSISLMAIPTAAVGFLPTYSDIGIAAPLLLLALRLLQGFAVGGEFPSAMSYLAEVAPRKHRGFVASFAMVGVCFGLLLANIVTVTVNTNLTAAEMADWGWRLPFVFALVLALLVLYLRLGLAESPIFSEKRNSPEAQQNPIVSAVENRWPAIVKIFFFLVFNSIAFYSVMVLATTYLSKTAGFSYESALIISLLGSFTMLVLLPLGGHISDRIGRRKSTGIAAFLGLVLSYPLYLAFGQGSFGLALAAQLIFVMVLALHVGPIPSLIAEQFGTTHRLSGVAIAFNLNLSIIGGTAPLLNEFFIQRTGWAEAPSIYLMIGAVVSLVAIYSLRETADQDLE